MIPRKYEGRPVVLCATGPSLTNDVVETLREFKDKVIIFGINDSYKIIDFLDEHYACDTRWWNMWGEDFKQKYPTLSAWTQSDISAKAYNVQHIPGVHKSTISTDPALIHFGQNSGFQALNIAYLMGGSRFILCGYNMGAIEGKSHFFGDHPPALNKKSPYDVFIRSYREIQPEIKAMVTNCTPSSALQMFMRADLRETLCSI
jgi:hypothetical protein